MFTDMNQKLINKQISEDKKSSHTHNHILIVRMKK